MEFPRVLKKEHMEIPGEWQCKYYNDWTIDLQQKKITSYTLLLMLMKEYWHRSVNKKQINGILNIVSEFMFSKMTQANVQWWVASSHKC